jgi:hypothetical protein
MSELRDDTNVTFPPYPMQYALLHCKKRLTIFLSPAGMSLTKLSLDGNNKIIPVQVERGK